MRLNKSFVHRAQAFLERHMVPIMVVVLTIISVANFWMYYQNGFGLAYNDARSHLDIGRRVVEGLKTGFAQLGSVWLPLPHLLMVPTIWNDFMWHTGLAGALQSMISFVFTSVLIYYYLRKIGVGLLARIFAVVVFVANINVLYMQSIAMTELLLMATVTAACYELLKWHMTDHVVNLIKSAWWIMLASLIRYDGWFLLVYAGMLIFLHTVNLRDWRKISGWQKAEGSLIFYGTLAGLGVIMWFLWNKLIFNDPFYFALGPYSAHAQQAQLESAGVLQTKGNMLLSIKFYFYALAYNSGALTLIFGMIGAFVMWFDRSLTRNVRLASTALLAPLFFNIIALYLGHSVLFIQGLSGNSWFNVRYGILMMPSIAIFTGYLIHKIKAYKWLIIGLFVFVTIFSFLRQDAVTLDDAHVGSSQKNVTEVSGWLNKYALPEKQFILISAASHDAIIFSSGLPMKRFIHEGTGKYWDSATANPDKWARWIILRTNDDNDQTFRLIKNKPGFAKYHMVKHFPFADIYELDKKYVKGLITDPIFEGQK